MNRLLCLLLCILGFSQISPAQSSTFTASAVLDGTGNPLALGYVCFGTTCLHVVKGVASGTIYQGTATLEVTDLSHSDILTIPNVTVSSSTFSLDTFVLTGPASGPNRPTLTCAIGATYAASYDGSTWACLSINGGTGWVSLSALASSAARPGTYGGPGAPTFYCTAPCLYTQSNANQIYAISALPGAVSNNWQLQTSGGGSSGGSNSSSSSVTITVAPTVTGNAGSSASVVNLGTTQNPILQFTIPQGVAGTTGGPGSTGPAGPAPSCTGIVKSNGTTASCATSGTDYPSVAQVTPTVDPQTAATVAQIAADCSASGNIVALSGSTTAYLLGTPTASSTFAKGCLTRIWNGTGNSVLITPPTGYTINTNASMTLAPQTGATLLSSGSAWWMFGGFNPNANGAYLLGWTSNSTIPVASASTGGILHSIQQTTVNGVLTFVEICSVNGGAWNACADSYGAANAVQNATMQIANNGAEIQGETTLGIAAAQTAWKFNIGCGVFCSYSDTTTLLNPLAKIIAAPASACSTNLSNTTTSFNPSYYQKYCWTLNGNFAPTFSALPGDGEETVMRFCQTGSNTYTVTLPSTVHIATTPAPATSFASALANIPGGSCLEVASRTWQNGIMDVISWGIYVQ